MKNIFRSKKFLFSMLAAACIGILAVCFVVNRDRDNDFQPEDVATRLSAHAMTSSALPATAFLDSDKVLSLTSA